MRRICIFCGANRGINPLYARSAQEMGSALASRGLGLVYGGGHVGLMGILAETVLAAGEEVIGVIPKALVEKEVAFNELKDLRVVASMHERKALMADLADAFIALPGGFGTLEEICEMLTWAQLGLHRKPCGLLNVAGYYDHLLTLFDHMVSEQYLHPTTRSLVLEDQDPDSLLDRLAGYQAPTLEQWIDRQDT